jgi:predicted RNase H-like HicB family nuclease
LLAERFRGETYAEAFDEVRDAGRVHFEGEALAEEPKFVWVSLRNAA